MLVEHVNNQDSTAPMDIGHRMNSRRKIVNREERHNTILQQLRERMSQEQLRANDLAKMEGASSWLINNIVIEVRKLYPEQNGVLRRAQP